MEANEKARELVEKFKPLVKAEWFNGHGYVVDEIETNNRSKQCAIIALDELLDYSGQLEPHLGCDYWQQVKTEIQKL